MSEISNTSDSGNTYGTSDKSKGTSKEHLSEWSDMISKVIDKLTGKDLQVTYTFDDVEIEIQRANGSEGKHNAGAKWKIDGKITISTELINDNKVSNSGNL
ncbi:hypothetical protein [Candidatus Nitrosocosmicus hydrocola]|jgi:hypothetical protein|uniref:hypothetical protein n=1 Tax=Candidatus Nitrosocosmicus hydrocola TaxID=1826872 RepID=UPI0011E5CC5A|nr:hypothetical protein [Candidatus Nitrosocosmicus hydrocola]